MTKDLPARPMELECMLNKLNYKLDYGDKTYCALPQAECPYRDLLTTDNVKMYSGCDGTTFEQRPLCNFANEQVDIYNSWRDYINEVKNGQ